MLSDGGDRPAGPALGNDAWSRHARRVLLLAGELNIPLDVGALLTCDVRDLLSLGWKLEQALSGRAGGRARTQRRRQREEGAAMTGFVVEAEARYRQEELQRELATARLRREARAGRSAATASRRPRPAWSLLLLLRLLIRRPAVSE